MTQEPLAQDLLHNDRLEVQEFELKLQPSAFWSKIVAVEKNTAPLSHKQITILACYSDVNWKGHYFALVLSFT